MITRKDILETLEAETLLHLAIVDRKDYEDLEQRKTTLLVRHPAKPRDHPAFSIHLSHASVSFGKTDLQRMSKDDLVMYFRRTRSILQEEWKGNWDSAIAVVQEEIDDAEREDAQEAMTEQTHNEEVVASTYTDPLPLQERDIPTCEEGAIMVIRVGWKRSLMRYRHVLPLSSVIED